MKWHEHRLKLFWIMELNETLVDANYNSTLLYELNHARMIFNIPVIVFLFINMFVGAMGNILVITVYIFFSERTVATYYISIVAFIDMVSCCFCLPFQIYDLWNPYINSLSTLCRIDRWLENFTNALNGFILICVASERYSKICYPLEPYTRSKAKSLTIIVVVMALSLSWPQLIITGKQTLVVGKDKIIGEDCSYNDYFQNSIYVVLFQGLLFTVWVFSFVSAFFFYFNILIVIVRRKREMKSAKKNQTNDDANQSQMSAVKSSPFRKYGSVNGRIKMRSSKTTVCLVSITLAAILSYVPFLTVQTVRTSGKYFQTTVTPSGEYYHYGNSAAVDLLCTFCVKSYLLNTAFNPIIYSVMNPKFRAKVRYAFRQIMNKFKGCLCKKNT
ncbi:orexin receptor type 2 [Patella vulgata]|uniref:orexin receptor type 2 n=1 Tax=Patella vulgata TaxID=6465 RepID=UPI0024A9A3D9|nr:orexin receptor type 2 [Patella vulgata]XP_050406738.2 orexin receptor type 2 [Patella vulgata]XP_055957453.1 orexin receptor type 2 [Patella vulgata]